MTTRTEGSGLRSNRNSLKTKLLDYLAENPEASLGRAEIAERFGASSKAVDNVLCELRRAGVMETIHVYRLVQGVTVAKRPQKLVKQSPASPKCGPRETKRAEWAFDAPFPLQDAWGMRASA